MQAQSLFSPIIALLLAAQKQGHSFKRLQQGCSSRKPPISGMEWTLDKRTYVPTVTTVLACFVVYNPEVLHVQCGWRLMTSSTKSGSTGLLYPCLCIKPCTLANLSLHRLRLSSASLLPRFLMVTPHTLQYQFMSSMNLQYDQVRGPLTPCATPPGEIVRSTGTNPIRDIHLQISSSIKHDPCGRHATTRLFPLISPASYIYPSSYFPAMARGLLSKSHSKTLSSSIAGIQPKSCAKNMHALSAA